MKPATAHDIELWLFDQGGWVAAQRLCDRFDVCDRRVRLLAEGAGWLVSRPGGYIHQYHATTEEIKAYCEPKKSHAAKEYRNARLVERNHRQLRRPYPVATDGQPSLL